MPGNGHDSIPMYIVLNGTASNQDWQSEYLLPDSINGAACVTLLKSDAWVRARGDSALLRTLLDETGPCIWYSTYGMPGPSISHWIRGNGISLMTRYDLPGQRDSVELDGDFGYFVPGMVYQASENLLTCLTGDETVCARLVMGRATRRDSTNYRIVTPEWFYRLPMGGESSAWLSDLQREMGFERFSRFWHSELPMTQAFQHAFGMEPGVWNREWLSRTYPEIYPGPLPRGRSVAYAGGVMLLLFGLAAAVAVRKVS